MSAPPPMTLHTPLETDAPPETAGLPMSRLSHGAGNPCAPAAAALATRNTTATDVITRVRLQSSDNVSTSTGASRQRWRRKMAAASSDLLTGRIDAESLGRQQDRATDRMQLCNYGGTK